MWASYRKSHVFLSRFQMKKKRSILGDYVKVSHDTNPSYIPIQACILAESMHECYQNIESQAIRFGCGQCTPQYAFWRRCVLVEWDSVRC